MQASSFCSFPKIRWVTSSVYVWAIFVFLAGFAAVDPGYGRENRVQNSSKNATAQKAADFVNWIGEEVRRIPAQPGGYWGRIPEKTLCSKAKELFPTTIRYDVELTIDQIRSDASTENPEAGMIDATSNYFIAAIITLACLNRDFLVYDPREHTTNSDDDRPSDSSSDDVVESSSRCRNGPRLIIRPEHVIALSHAIRALERLNRISFECVMTARQLFFDIYTTVDDLEFINSAIWIFNWRGGKIKRVKVIGTLPDLSTKPDKRGVIAYPGMKADVFAISGAEVEDVEIKGVEIGSFMVGNSRIERSVTISRSQFNSVIVSDSKLKDFAIFESRIGAEKPSSDGKLKPYGGLHFTNNDVERDVRLGAWPQLAVATSNLTPTQMDQLYGPRPKWLDEEEYNNKSLLIRGYVTLGGARIDGELLVHGLDLAGADVGTTDQAEPSGPGGKMHAFFNINGVKAGRILFYSSVVKLGQSTGLAAEDVEVRGNISIEYSAFWWRDSDNENPSSTNRPTGVSENDWKGPTLGFINLRARDLIIRQSLLSGPTVLMNSSVRAVHVLTLPYGRGSEAESIKYCWREIKAHDLRSDQSETLRGSLIIDVLWPIAKSEKEHPACYGSILIKNSDADFINAYGLLSDIYVVGSTVQRFLQISGRVSGVVNLASLSIPNGFVALGHQRRPLRWCSQGDLLMDGIRISALLADRESFLRHDCDNDKPGPIGPLRVSMRGAQIDRILGQVRLSPADPTDTGLLGLSAERLIEIAAPHNPEHRPLKVRLANAAERLFKPTDRKIDAGDAPQAYLSGLDPQTLADFAARLKSAGHNAKATQLSIERVRRQKWESDAPVERMKWLLGYPVGWGYATEWAFVYALLFLLVGAWVSAYYREHPSLSPPDQGWAKSNLRRSSRLRSTVTNAAKRQAIYSAILKAASVLAAIVFGLAFLLSLPPFVPLTETETLGLVAVMICALVLARTRLLSLVWRVDFWKEAALFVAAGRGMGVHSFFFSLDRFLPTPSFHAYWGNYPRIGQAGRNYFYIHRLIGLLLISVVAASVTGLFD